MKAAIQDYLDAHLPDDLFIVDIQVSESKNQVSVFLDGDAGISVDTCGKVSKKLEKFLDEASEVPTAYTLNVSSAGLDKPLYYPRQFKKNVNRNINVTTENKNYQGRLVLVSNDHLMIQPSKQDAVVLKMNQIQKALVEI
jgi:ribosome maturation factor RimP